MTDMDWVRLVLDQAARDNLTLDLLRSRAEWADTLEQWAKAVNDSVDVD